MTRNLPEKPQWPKKYLLTLLLYSSRSRQEVVEENDPAETIQARTSNPGSPVGPGKGIRSGDPGDVSGAPPRLHHHPDNRLSPRNQESRAARPQDRQRRYF